MTEPGWYNAEGDPAGTQRYWDGGQWVGEPAYEPAASPGPVMYPPQQAAPPLPYPDPASGGYSYAQPSSTTFPGSLKALAIIVSVLKSIPLILGLIAVALLATLANEFNDDTFFFEEGDLGGLFNAAIIIIVVVVLIGAVLLGLQFVGALTERPMMVFVPALIMSILDSLSTLGAWAGFFSAQGNTFDNPSPGGPVLMTAITAAQIAVAVMALKANKA